MRLRNFHLFSLPIDNTYENVFDGYLTYSTTKQAGMIEYDRVLRDIYGAHSTGNLDFFVYNKSVKISNGVSTITLPLSYEIVRNYNYIIINLSNISEPAPYSNMNFQAFFITSVVSENDSYENPSCSVTIEYDVWANNYFSLVKENNNNCKIDEGHIDRISKIENGNVTMRTIPLPSPRSIPTTYTNYTQYNSENLGSENSPFKMLWIAIELDNDADFYLKQSTDALVTPSLIKSETDYGVFKYIFVPYRWVNDDGTLYKTFIEYIFGEHSKIIDCIDNINQIFDDNEKIRTHIKNMFFTYTPPFLYNTIGLDFQTGSYISINAAINEEVTNLVGQICSNSTGANPSSYEGFVYTKSQVYKTLISENVVMNRSDISINYFIHEYGENSGAVNAEIPYNNYPYSFVSAEINGSKLPLYSEYSFSGFSMKILPYVYGNNITVEYKLGDNVIGINNTTVENNGYIPFTYELSQEYFRQNGAKIGLSVLSNAVKMLSPISGFSPYVPSSSSLTIGPMGGVSNIQHSSIPQLDAREVTSQISSLGATILDLRNSRDTVNNAQSVGSLNYFRLDRPLLTVTNIVLSEDFLTDYYLTLSRGYIYSRFANAIENNRYLFDFVRSNNFKALSITNIMERNKIERIFSSGVRKWHIDNFNRPIFSSSQKSRILKLDYTVINPEPELLPYFPNTTEV